MATVTITIPNTGWETSGTDNINWQGPFRFNSSSISLGTSLSTDGATELFLNYLLFPRGATDFRLQLALTAMAGINEAGPDFSTQMETSGTITFTTTGGDSLTLTGISDSTEPYQWRPSNITEVNTFADTLAGLSDRTLTVVFDDQSAVAPSFPNPTGTPQSWMRGQAITDITVPEADGAPAPTYAVESSLPAGILFDATTRVISGTPMSTGSGTITIRATNSEGTADWTVDYTTTTTDFAPSFAESGYARAWIVGTAIADITVPVASAQPSATYTVVGTLPSGIMFDATTRVISGTLDAAGSGFIRIRATNTEGTDDWVLPWAAAASFGGHPDYRIEVDWDGDGGFSHANANIWEDVQRFKCHRGREYGDMIYGRSEAGLLEIILRNDDDTYNRFNATSPLRGLAVPGRTVRFSILDETTFTYEPQWGGQLWNIDRRQRQGGDLATFTGKGNLVDLRREIEAAMRTSITASDAAVAVLDAAKVPARKRGSIGGTRTMGRWWSPLQPAIDAMREIEETELGFLLEDKLGRIAMQREHARATAFLTSKMTLNADGAGAGIPITMADPLDPSKSIANIVRVPLRTFTVGAEAVLWILPQAPTLTPGQSFTYLAFYPTPDSPNAALGVDAWTAIAATTDYEANSLVDGTGTDLTSSLEVTTATATDLATSREIVVENTGAVDLFITKLQTRGTPVTEGTPATIVERDQDSIDEYEEQPYTVPSQFISDVVDAESYANFLLALLKDPQMRIPVEFEASDYLADVMGVDLSDRVSLTLEGETEDYFVEAITHEILRGGQHYVEFLLSPVSVYGDTYILDSEPTLDNGVLLR